MKEYLEQTLNRIVEKFGESFRSEVNLDEIEIEVNDYEAAFKVVTQEMEADIDNSELNALTISAREQAMDMPLIRAIMFLTGIRHIDETFFKRLQKLQPKEFHEMATLMFKYVI